LISDVARYECNRFKAAFASTSLTFRTKALICVFFNASNVL
jgi:hypothetical protein